MVEQINQPIRQIQAVPRRDVPLIDAQEIKQILYMGLRGDVSLPVEDRKVDILV